MEDKIDKGRNEEQGKDVEVIIIKEIAYPILERIL